MKVCACVRVCVCVWRFVGVVCVMCSRLLCVSAARVWFGNVLLGKIRSLCMRVCVHVVFVPVSWAVAMHRVCLRVGGGVEVWPARLQEASHSQLLRVAAARELFGKVLGSITRNGPTGI